MGEELIQRFKQKAEAVSAEVFIARDLYRALEEAMSWLRTEQKLKITADDRLAGILTARGPAGFNLVFPEKPEQFAELQAAMVEADLAVAETGTLVHLDATPRDLWRWTLPENCLAFINRDKIVASMEELLETSKGYLLSEGAGGSGWERDEDRAANEAKQISFVTGPSRTADIEGQLEIGVHGPLRLLIFIY